MRVYSASPESSRIYIYNQTFVSLRHRSRCRMAHSGDLCHHRLAAMTPYLPVSNPWFSTRCCPPELIPGILVWRQIKNQTYSCSVAPKETQFLHVLCHFSVGSLKSNLHPVHGVTTSDPQPWEGFGPCLPYRSYSRASTKWSGDHEKVSSVSIQNWLWIGELR